MILANDDRPRTMHAEAERTDRALLPEAVSALLDRNDGRRAGRAEKWRQYAAQARARAAAYRRLSAATRDIEERATAQTRSIDSLEL
jgi:hypothetical protein